MERVPADSSIARLLIWAEGRGASDVHGRAGSSFVVRVVGRLDEVPSDEIGVPNDAELQAWFDEAFSPGLTVRIRTGLEVDASFEHGPVRYRANFSKQRGSQSFSFRVVPQQRHRLVDLQLPGSLGEMMRAMRGLILVTGPTGQGKSTTVRAMLQQLAEERAVRIITIEDPIEHLFADARSHFEQREVGIDTATFADGIRNAMRQDPNVIFVGEIRDRESIWAAMQAAETGHLIVSTLHADSVAQAIGRLREHYPVAEQGALSALLARNLNAIICQRLVPNLSGKRTPCLEILKRDAGVQEAIRENRLSLLEGIVEASNHSGMHTFDQYLQELMVAGMISADTAREYAVNRHRLDLALRGIVMSQPILERKA